MNFIEALAGSTSTNNGMIDERTLDEEEKELLKKVRKMSKVTSMQRKYNIDPEKALQDAKEKAEGMEENLDEITMDR